MIGDYEYTAQACETAICHWKIAAEAGNQQSLNKLKTIFYAKGKLPGKEFISKDELDKLYRVCYEAQMEVQSDSREKCAVDPDDMRC